MAEAIEYQVGDRTVRVSNPDKIYFPERGFTKRDVVEYYLAVGDGILRALKHRPTTLERWPGGVVEGAKLVTRQGGHGDAFYQKRVPKGAPDWVDTATIAFPSGRTADEVCPGELAVVAWAANLGTVTFHPWPVRGSDVDHPDELRIDIDPQPGTGFSDVVAAAAEARALLDELIRHTTQRQFVYTHRWRPHELVMWDNRCTMHRGSDYDDLRWVRDMSRVTISDVANSCEQEGIAVAA